MNIKESIRRILSEETQIPSVIRRRVSSDDIEEAFEFALEQNADSMNNPRSIIFKEKEPTTLWVFSKFVIDDIPLQTIVLYTTQKFCSDRDFPKGIFFFF
jgi:hypothetical protein